jgi:hypothetical protein
MATIKNRPIARMHLTYNSGIAVYQEDLSQDRLLVGFFGGSSKPRAKWLDIIAGPDGGAYIEYWPGEPLSLDEFVVCH